MTRRSNYFKTCCQIGISRPLVTYKLNICPSLNSHIDYWNDRIACINMETLGLGFLNIGSLVIQEKVIT